MCFLLRELIKLCLDLEGSKGPMFIFQFKLLEPDV